MFYPMEETRERGNVHVPALRIPPERGRQGHASAVSDGEVVLVQSGCESRPKGSGPTSDVFGAARSTQLAWGAFDPVTGEADS